MSRREHGEYHPWVPHDDPMLDGSGGRKPPPAIAGGWWWLVVYGPAVAAVIYTLLT